jgi:hypothetical protein
MGEKRNAYVLLLGKPEGKKTTGKTKTKVDFGEIRWGGVD